MTLLTIKANPRIWYVLRQPLAVRERHHPILSALPYSNWPLDLCQVESPVPGERQVIVPPTGDAARHCAADAAGHELRELAGQRHLIDLGDQASECGRDIRCLDVAEDFRLFMEPWDKRRLPLPAPD